MVSRAGHRSPASGRTNADPSIKTAYDVMARDWLALAEQAEWMRNQHRRPPVKRAKPLEQSKHTPDPSASALQPWDNEGGAMKGVRAERPKDHTEVGRSRRLVGRARSERPELHATMR